MIEVATRQSTAGGANDLAECGAVLPDDLVPLAVDVSACGACQCERHPASRREIIVVRADESVGLNPHEAPLVDVQGVVRVDLKPVNVPFY